MSRARILACLLPAVLLAGCGILPDKTPISLYSPPVVVRPDPSWPAVRGQLVVQRPNAEGLLDSPRIVVQPTPGEVQVYKGAIWADAAPDLLQTAVIHALEDSGKLTGVGRRGSGVAGDYELLMDIRHFDANYAAGAAPSAVIDVQANLVLGQENKVVASQLFHASAPAAGTQIPEVSQAFGTALSDVTRQITGWTLSQAATHPVKH